MQFAPTLELYIRFIIDIFYVLDSYIFCLIADDTQLPVQYYNVLLLLLQTLHTLAHTLNV